MEQEKLNPAELCSDPRSEAGHYNVSLINIYCFYRIVIFIQDHLSRNNTLELATDNINLRSPVQLTKVFIGFSAIRFSNYLLRIYYLRKGDTGWSILHLFGHNHIVPSRKNRTYKIIYVKSRASMSLFIIYLIYYLLFSAF